MTVVVPAVLICLLGASEFIRDSSDRRLQALGRVLTAAIVPFLLLFSYYVIERMLEVF